MPGMFQGEKEASIEEAEWAKERIIEKGQMVWGTYHVESLWSVRIWGFTLSEMENHHMVLHREEWHYLTF